MRATCNELAAFYKNSGSRFKRPTKVANRSAVDCVFLLLGRQSGTLVGRCSRFGSGKVDSGMGPCRLRHKVSQSKLLNTFRNLWSTCRARSAAAQTSIDCRLCFAARMSLHRQPRCTDSAAGQTGQGILFIRQGGPCRCSSGRLGETDCSNFGTKPTVKVAEGCTLSGVVTVLWYTMKM